MHVHRSNRAEALVDVLSDIVAQPLPDPAAAECIAVQGRGMERWLSMELARRLGVWANPHFPFPRKLLEDAIAAVLGADGELSPCFAPETMLWSIADVLPRHLAEPAFAPIRSYLADDERGVKRLQLAERIANTFDQYVVYRPKMVLEWENGAGSDWQAALWRALIARHGSKHVAARATAFLAAVDRRSRPLDGFPTRVSVFGVSTLPPLYLALLAALSRVVELHLFVLSPSREYWADIRSQRDMLRTLRTQQARNTEAAADLHVEEGHPLLASLGRLGRDFQCVLEDTGRYVEDDADLYHDPGTGSMLATVQSDILGLRHRRPLPRPLCEAETGAREESTLPPSLAGSVDKGEERASRASARAVADPFQKDFSAHPEALEGCAFLHRDDDSIRIHACHGPMREVEVLHDQLLALFDADRSLQPHEVAVMSPTIDAYAPFVEAVFGGEHSQGPRIPYRIADRQVRATEPVADGFARLLDTLRGRMTAPEVLDLLAIDAIRARFGIAAEEIDLVRTWVTQAGIRWGADAAHRAEVEQPAVEANTWRFGLDRLFLGYAMPGKEQELYNEVLPYDDIEGTTTDVLGRLAELCATLFAFRKRLQGPRTLDAWCEDLGALLEGMVESTNQTAYQHHRIRNALAALAERAHAGGFDEAVDLDAVRARLDVELERSAPAHGFLSGGVTFCALVPMRTIPFRVVCLLGMNDGAFPRARRPLGFDLMAQHPLPGDRSVRDDDRYLFLESLLSARERLLITYVGQSISDNTEIPPSVVVSELLDVLGESFVAAPETVGETANEPYSSQTNSSPDPFSWKEKGRPLRSPLSFQERGIGSEFAQRTAPAAVRAHVVVRHPLQPFSPSYFGASSDARLFSYARSYRDGASSLVHFRQSHQPFLSTPLPLDDAAVRMVTLDDLVRFFEHPVRAFLQRRLGLYLGDDAEVVEEREPLELDYLQQWQIGDALLGPAIEHVDLRSAFPAVRATGRLPLGVLGQCVFDDVRPYVEAIASLAAPLLSGGRLQPVEINHHLDDTHITGLLRDVWPVGQVRWQYSKLGGRHELGFWIRHLVLNWVAPADYPRDSHLVGRPAKEDGPGGVRFCRVEDPQAILRELLRLYWLGQTLPLALFPRTSRAYAEILRKTANAAEALVRARPYWAAKEPVPGDGEDAYVKQVFGDSDPLDPALRVVEAEDAVAPSFHELATAVFGPLLEHRKDGV